MIERNYDAMVNRWFRCVERGHHTFISNNETCIECGAVQRDPQVKIVRGPVRQPAKK